MLYKYLKRFLMSDSSRISPYAERKQITGSGWIRTQNHRNRSPFIYHLSYKACWELVLGNLHGNLRQKGHASEGVNSNVGPLSTIKRILWFKCGRLICCKSKTKRQLLSDSPRKEMGPHGERENVKWLT